MKWHDFVAFAHALMLSATTHGLVLLLLSASSTMATDDDDLPPHMMMKISVNKQAAKWHAESGLLKETFGRFRRDNKCNDIAQTTASGFNCSKMDLDSFISPAEMGSVAAEKFQPLDQEIDWINDIWYWESPRSRRKYALAGFWDGTGFVDITDSRNPVAVGFVETAGDLQPGNYRALWRDIKVVNDFAYIGSEIRGHGVQVFNLTRLDAIPRPKTVIGYERPTGTNIQRLQADNVIHSIGGSHNIVGFEDDQKVLVVGIYTDTSACSISDGETVAVLDVSSDPTNPPVECLSLGSILNPRPKRVPPYPIGPGSSMAGYVHDAQCEIYKGPDDTYFGQPICFFYAETEVGIFDMENRELISYFTYSDAGYVHQGWMDENHATLYLNDEIDEQRNTYILAAHCLDPDRCDQDCQDYCSEWVNPNPEGFPNTRIFDIRSLDNVGPAREFINTKAGPAIDHNLYVKGGHIYSAAYTAGARIYKILGDKSLEEAAYFDMADECDGLSLKECPDPFFGSWTHIPYGNTKSLASSTVHGLFLFSTRLNANEKRSEVCSKYAGSPKKCMKNGCAYEGSECKSAAPLDEPEEAPEAQPEPEAAPASNSGVGNTPAGCGAQGSKRECRKAGCTWRKDVGKCFGGNEESPKASSNVEKAIAEEQTAAAASSVASRTSVRLAGIASILAALMKV